MSKESIAKCRKIQFDILCSIKDLCDREGIRLILLEEAALAAYRGEFETDFICVGIDAADVYKFIDAFDRDEGRLRMDSMRTNGDFPDFELRVYDPDTIDFSNVEFMKYRYNSLYLKLRIIQHVPANRIRKAILASVGSAYVIRNRERFGLRDESAGRMVKLLRKREARTGRDAAAAWVFDKLVKGYSNSSDRIIVGEDKFKAAVIGEGRAVEVNGRKFLIPAQTKRYFEKVFGRKWNESEIPQFVESIKEFRDPDHSWDELKERISYMDFDGYYENLREYYAGRRRFRAYHDDVNRYRHILSRTDMRFKLWQKYMPMKEELTELHSKGDYKKLEELLGDYMLSMEQCEKDGLGLCFDEDILNITLDVYRHRGDEEHAALLGSLVPDEHREKLRLMDYRGEIIE